MTPSSTPTFRFAHIINIEFFSDLVSVFQELVSGGSLATRDTLLAISTVFAILSGQGEALNIDPTSFYQHLYSTLFSLNWTSCTSSTTALALRALHDMLIKRRKKVSRARVLAFTKRVASLALQLDHGGAVGALGVVRALHTTHPCTSVLLDPEHEVGSGVFDPHLADPEHCSASNTTAWEHALLAAHYHPQVARLSRHVLAGAPTTGEASLPAELKLREVELVEAYTMEAGAFNPPVEPPAKKARKKVRGSPVSQGFLAAPATADPAGLDLHTLITQAWPAKAAK